MAENGRVITEKCQGNLGTRKESQSDVRAGIYNYSFFTLKGN